MTKYNIEKLDSLQKIYEWYDNIIKIGGVDTPIKSHNKNINQNEESLQICFKHILLYFNEHYFGAIQQDANQTFMTFVTYYTLSTNNISGEEEITYEESNRLIHVNYNFKPTSLNKETRQTDNGIKISYITTKISDLEDTQDNNILSYTNSDNTATIINIISKLGGTFHGKNIIRKSNQTYIPEQNRPIIIYLSRAKHQADNIDTQKLYFSKKYIHDNLVQYTIRAVIVKEGDLLNSGHYVTYLFDNSSNKWWYCSDSDIKECDADNLMKMYTHWVMILYLPTNDTFYKPFPLANQGNTCHAAASFQLLLQYTEYRNKILESGCNKYQNKSDSELLNDIIKQILTHTFKMSKNDISNNVVSDIVILYNDSSSSNTTELTNIIAKYLNNKKVDISFYNKHKDLHGLTDDIQKLDSNEKRTIYQKYQDIKLIDFTQDQLKVYDTLKSMGVIDNNDKDNIIRLISENNDVDTILSNIRI